MKYSTCILWYYRERESGEDMKYSAEGEEGGRELSGEWTSEFVCRSFVVLVLLLRCFTVWLILSYSRYFSRRKKERAKGKRERQRDRDRERERLFDPCSFTHVPCWVVTKDRWRYTTTYIRIQYHNNDSNRFKTHVRWQTCQYITETK